MIVCPNCSKSLENHVKFCDGCGIKLEEAAQADLVEKTMVMMPNAAPEAEEPTPEPVVESPIILSEEVPDKKKKGGAKKGVIFGSVGAVALVSVVSIVLVVAIIVGAFAIPALFGGDDSNDVHGVVYYKDGQLFFNSLNGKKSVQLTEELFSEDILESSSFSGFSEADTIIPISRDGKTVFYPDNIEKGDDGFNLYYRNVSKKKAEAVKVDSDIIGEYYVSSNGNLVTYGKYRSDDTVTLYQYNVKKDDKEKIASSCSYFTVSDDGKTIFFKDDDGDLYYKKYGKDEEKLASNASRVEHITDDCKIVYYTRESGLYKHVLGKDREKLASDVDYVAYIYESGEMYYIQIDEDGDHSLIYNNGKKETVVARNVEAWSYTYSYDSAIAVYQKFDNYYVATKGKSVKIDADAAYGATFTNNGKDLYLVANYDSESESGDVYKVTTSNGKAKLYDTDVWRWSIYFGFDYEGKTNVYFKDVESIYSAEMYVNKKRIDTDVDAFSSHIIGSKVVYLADYDTEESCGTLKMYNGKKSTVISEDVNSLRVSSEDHLVYLSDYSTRYEKGTLYHYNSKGKSVKIDDDVEEYFYLSNNHSGY